MNKYEITPELSEYIDQLNSSLNQVDLFIVAVNFALKKSGQPEINTQADLDEFVSLFSLKKSD